MAATPKKTEASAPVPPPPEGGFDARLERLERLVAELEGGGLSLETSIERFREGAALVRECRTLLAGFQKRVEELANDSEGGVKPYAGDPDARERA